MVLKSLILVSSTLFFSNLSMASLTLNKVPEEIKLEGETGGKVKGGAWSSKEMLGKVTVLFYAIDEETNEHAVNELKKENFPSDGFSSIAVVNMASIKIFNWLISIKLENSQKKNNRTLYVEDKKKVLVDRWKLADKTSNIVIFNKKGEVVFSVDGKLNDQQIKDMLSIIKTELAKNSTQSIKDNQTETQASTHKH